MTTDVRQGGDAMGAAARRFKPGFFYTWWNNSGDTAAAALVAGTGALMPFVVDVAGTFDQASIEVTVVAPGSTYELALYDDDGQGKPGALRRDFGAADTASAIGVIGLPISPALVVPPGLYWLGGLPLGGVPTVRCRTQASTPLGPASTGGNQNVSNWSAAGLAAWPASAAAFTPNQSGTLPKVMLRGA